jgi:hypothetical protein
MEGNEEEDLLLFSFSLSQFEFLSLLYLSEYILVHCLLTVTCIRLWACRLPGTSTSVPWANPVATHQYNKHTDNTVYPASVLCSTVLGTSSSSVGSGSDY